ncbi:Pyrophosphate--fructose 6-phosphate 1-phosphotransferase [bioreactor metagenome]|uniref:Pyrophosphate--fructose 6-phosphate 1-phosphotransferase n=1 Tax=bioreactor metagenome TaxID=1076179 RepID=A0A644TMU5_9ZZZZ
MGLISPNILAILCGGGPAPGINSVISSVTIEAINNGWDVLGIIDGFAHLSNGEKKTVPLSIDRVSRIHLDGGSILKTSRFNPTKNETYLRNTINTLIILGVTHLVTIGGDDTAYSAARLSDYAQKVLGIDLRVAHVPKTIDNDLPLPEGIPTFGFETARSLGAQIVSNLMEDAKTSGRWFFAVVMGRTAGHLALGIGKSAGATVTIIPEEFGEGKIKLQQLVDILTGSIIKRLAGDKSYGVAVIAEGLFEKIDQESVLQCACRDEHGHIRYTEVNFADLLKQAVLQELSLLGINMTVVGKEIGYEVRCAPPNAFDIEYTRNLGFAAFEFLQNGGTNAIISIQNNQIVPLAFDSILDADTGRTQVRMVNINSIQYRIARQYMIRVEKQDFHSNGLKRMALLARLPPDEFVKKFKYLTE